MIREQCILHKFVIYPAGRSHVHAVNAGEKARWSMLWKSSAGVRPLQQRVPQSRSRPVMVSSVEVGRHGQPSRDSRALQVGMQRRQAERHLLLHCYVLAWTEQQSPRFEKSKLLKSLCSASVSKMTLKIARRPRLCITWKTVISERTFQVPASRSERQRKSRSRAREIGQVVGPASHDSLWQANPGRRLLQRDDRPRLPLFPPLVLHR